MTPRRSLIFDATVRLVFDGALVVSLYLLFSGHNQPGGGFVGGLVAGAAIALRYLAGGLDEVDAVVRVPPWAFLSAGLATAATAGLVPLLAGDGPLHQATVEADVALLGHVKLATATVFDAGVYLVVVGLVLMILEGLGEAPQGGGEPEGGDAP